jgi:hypothetical protein
MLTWTYVYSVISFQCYYLPLETSVSDPDPHEKADPDLAASKFVLKAKAEAFKTKP